VAEVYLSPVLTWRRKMTGRFSFRNAKEIGEDAEHREEDDDGYQKYALLAVKRLL